MEKQQARHPYLQGIQHHLVTLLDGRSDASSPLAGISTGLQRAISSAQNANPIKFIAVAATATAEKINNHFLQHQYQHQQVPILAHHPDDERVICLEYTKGKRRVYRTHHQLLAGKEGSASKKKSTSTSNNRREKVAVKAFDISDEIVSNQHKLRDVFADFLLPQGFPDSVAPQYAKYMGWRGVQYFFGGAMSVYTTKSLLKALGVGQKFAGESAAAINWVVKDGAGRMGRFLFARWGKKLDGELKQFRLAGDLLMEGGAALELSTALAPAAFLPLACTANLAKNLAAVAASSTRAPIYRTFARQNNLADVTAKGESVANLADVFGTAFGILLTKFNLPVGPTFAILSAGYLLASRKEVDSVVLPYLNHARLSYATRKFFDTGRVPGLEETNASEPLLPWTDPVGGRVVIGATVEDACTSPEDLSQALSTFPGRSYAITYRADTKKAYLLLKQGVDSDAILSGTVDALTLLYLIDKEMTKKWWNWPAAGSKRNSTIGNTSININSSRGSGKPVPPAATLPRPVSKLQKAVFSSSSVVGAVDNNNNNNDEQEIINYVANNGKELHGLFEKKAAAAGWMLKLSTLNATDTRLVVKS